MAQRFFRVVLLYIFCTLTGWSLASASERILWIGDSQTVSSLSYINHNLFNQNHHQLFIEGRRGASPRFYLDRPTAFAASAVTQDERQELHYQSNTRSNPLLGNLINRYEPSIVVVQLGGNLLGQSQNIIEHQIEGILSKIESAPNYPLCYWIGPPPGWGRNQVNYNRFYQTLYRKLNNRCYLFDSRDVITYPRQIGDGIHYDKITKAELVLRGICNPATHHNGREFLAQCASGPERYLHFAKAVYDKLRNIYRQNKNIDLGPINMNRAPTVDFLESYAADIMRQYF